MKCGSLRYRWNIPAIFIQPELLPFSWRYILSSNMATAAKPMGKPRFWLQLGPLGVHFSGVYIGRWHAAALDWVEFISTASLGTERDGLIRPMGVISLCNPFGFLEAVRIPRLCVLAVFYVFLPVSVLQHKYHVSTSSSSSYAIIPLKRKATFLGQQTFRLNDRSLEQQSKKRRQNTEWYSRCHMQERITLESLRTRSAEEVVALARERYRF